MQTAYRHFSFSIAAGGIRPLSVYGRFITLLASTSPIKMSIDDKPYETLREGLSVELPEELFYKKMIFFNDTASSIDVEVAFSAGAIYDTRNVVTGEIDVNLTGNIYAPTVIAVPSAAEAQIVTADTTIRDNIVQNIGAFNMWVSITGVTVNNGLCIVPLQSISINCYADLFAIGELGNTRACVLKIRRT